MLANLTGHDIYIVDRHGTVVTTIKPCETEEPLRAEVTMRRQRKIEGIKLTKLYYRSNITERKMQELLNKYEGIIVSKITAECLKELGYTDKIYITGRKFYRHGELIGVKELCIL